MILKRNEAVIEVNEVNVFIIKSLNYSNTFSHCTFFNNNNIPYLYEAFPQMLMFGCLNKIKQKTADPFNDLKIAYENEPDWYTGYFGYDLKNTIESLSSINTDRIGFPDFYFYRPEYVIIFNPSSVKIITYEDPLALFQKINDFETKNINPNIGTNKKIDWQPAMAQEEYIRKVDEIRNHILKGDIYEMNFCLEFFTEDVQIEPLAIYLKFNDRSPMPFSIYGRYDNQYLLCASPERFLKKVGKELISQPIKGTARRGHNAEDDDRIKSSLRNDEKERAENLMIVDLVRNDLAKSSIPGSVKVKELFGIYTFRQVHQMISTITSEIREEVHFTEAIKNAFPMGSMTGAPKIKVMELIEHFENSKRGAYSGAAGYITPYGDFDFNVIIRSLFYNDSTKMLSFQVGSAITYDSIPEKEYEECLLKAQAMIEVSLEQDSQND